MNKLSSLVLSTIVTILLLVVGSHHTMAEQKKTLGNWDVHYIAFGTTFLTPEIARANGIVRSKSNALINISVLDKTSQEAQSVEITGSARNLLGNNKKLAFKEVKEGDAIYYLAVLSHDDKETYRFNIDIKQGNNSQVLQFQQLMYENEN